MRIMTSNIWGDFFNNPTKLREDGLFAVYEKYCPDVIGFQECAAGWYDAGLFGKLSKNYHFVGVEYFEQTNSTPIAIKKDYKVIAKGHEQLENTPDFSKSITWAVAEKDGKRAAVCNTHFWWMRGTENENAQKAYRVVGWTFEDHCELRAQNARQLSGLMKYLSEKYSADVFAFGDLNSTVTETVFEAFSENGIKLLYDKAKQKDTICSVHGDPVLGDDGRFHGNKATAEYIAGFRKRLCLPEISETDGYFSSIDHIVALGDDFEVTQYRVVEDKEALDSSDHSPLFADIVN